MGSSKTLRNYIIAGAILGIVAVVAWNVAIDQNRPATEESGDGPISEKSSAYRGAESGSEGPGLPLAEAGPGLPPVVPFDAASKEKILAAVGPQNERVIRLRSRYLMTSPRESYDYPLGSQHIYIQFDRIPTEEERERLAADGIGIEAWVGSNAYTARVTPDSYERLLSYPIFVGSAAIAAVDKIPAPLFQGEIDPYAKDGQGNVILSLLVYPGVVYDDLVLSLSSNVVEFLSDSIPVSRLVEVRVREDRILEVAAADEIEGLDTIHEITSTNKNAANLSGVTTLLSGPLGLDGSGVRVGVWDGGAAGHSDYNSRTLR